MVDDTDQAKAFAARERPFTPTHISHKQVEAYPIAAAEFHADGSGNVGINDPERGYIVVPVPPGFLRHPGAVSEGDMLVRYAPTVNEPNGYLSHSPRAVFEDGYSSIRPAEHRKSYEGGGRGLSFGQAIEQLKAGDRVARDGWNGKGMFLLLWPAGAMGGADLPGDAWCPSFVAMRTAEAPPTSEFGSVVRPWNASQADMLAEDWCVVLAGPAAVEAPRSSQDLRSRGEPRVPRHDAPSAA